MSSSYLPFESISLNRSFFRKFVTQKIIPVVINVYYSGYDYTCPAVSSEALINRHLLATLHGLCVVDKIKSLQINMRIQQRVLIII